MLEIKLLEYRKVYKKTIRYQKIKRKRDQFHKISILLLVRVKYSLLRKSHQKSHKNSQDFKEYKKSCLIFVENIHPLSHIK